MLIAKFENGRKFYQDNLGHKYQYNLEDLIDFQNYAVDTDAQLRDKLCMIPTRNELGGGIYD
ncbi:hypothetical protein [Haemophilus haemolyticus]|jgi:hypothetical protein|uniref:hypothetical protein n=1 Tax=Haemophilus haemolyticus TaxID=726 RepID=UPI000E5861D3|nr:hypothetical protein [Haemophilus haemolyticus]